MASRREFIIHATVAGVASSYLKVASAVENAQFALKAPASRSEGIVQTVLGPLDASKLGFTLAHEHIADAPDVVSRWPKAWGGRPEFVAKAVDRLKLIKAAGVSTVDDLTTYDVGRDIRFLEEVSRRSGLNMIACTGQRFFPPMSRHLSMPARTIAGLTEFFVKEIDHGIDGTGIKAGVIKIGIITNHVTSPEEIGLRAGARACKA